MSAVVFVNFDLQFRDANPATTWERATNKLIELLIFIRRTCHPAGSARRRGPRRPPSPRVGRHTELRIFDWTHLVIDDRDDRQQSSKVRTPKHRKTFSGWTLGTPWKDSTNATVPEGFELLPERCTPVPLKQP